MTARQTRRPANRPLRAFTRSCCAWAMVPFFIDALDKPPPCHGAFFGNFRTINPCLKYPASTRFRPRRVRPACQAVGSRDARPPSLADNRRGRPASMNGDFVRPDRLSFPARPPPEPATLGAMCNIASVPLVTRLFFFHLAPDAGMGAEGSPPGPMSVRSGSHYRDGGLPRFL